MISSSMGALRRPLQGAIKGIPSRVLETPHASFGALRTLPRHASIGHPSKVAIPFSAFSTRATHLDHTQSDRKSDPNYWGSKAFVPLAMSFESLGIRKNTQLLVMLVLTVGALLETMLWAEKAWVWWKGEEGDRIDTV